MTKLTITPPSSGELNTVAEPRVGTALKRIEEWANGEVGTTNVTAGSITEAMLEAALATKIGAKLSGLTVTIKTSESYTAKNGDLVVMIGAGGPFTVTLPAPTASVVIGIAAPLVECKVKTPSGAILGDFANAATVALAAGQHLTVEAEGSNYLILAGEPKKTAEYSVKTYTKAEVEAGIEISATRDALVSEKTGAVSAPIEIGGKAGPNPANGQVRVPAGQKLKAGNALASVELYVLVE